MYTYEGHENFGAFNILDTQGDVICSVETRSEAEALLSHLNR